MGVMTKIRWKSDDGGKWQGHLGWCHVATVGNYPDHKGKSRFTLSVLEDFPGFNAFFEPCESMEHGTEIADELLQEWLDASGLVFKLASVEPQLPLTWRRKQIGNRMVSAGYIGKTEVCHVFDPGYHGIEAWVVQVLQSFPGGPTTLSTADIFATSEEAKEAAQHLYDRFLLETRLKAGAA